MTIHTDTPSGGAPQLRRELNIWEAIGISVALMAPSMAANINPQGTAGTVGRAVPLAFALATVGVLLVAYTFVRLCQRFNHAGSVYAFVGATLGPRAGVVAGWALTGTYVFYGVVTSMAAGIFGTSFLQEVGLWDRPPTNAPFLIAGILLAAVCLLAAARIRGGTRLLQHRGGHHGAADSDRQPGRARQTGRRLCAGWAQVHPGCLHRAVRHAGHGTVPGGGLRVPVLRRLRGVGDPG